MVRVRPVDTTETLPATSVSVLFSVCVAAARLVVVIAQAPAATVALPTMVAPSRSVTTSPSTPVPLMVGVVTLVMRSLFEKPLSLACARASAPGAAVEVTMCRFSAGEVAEASPATSVSTAVSTCRPSLRPLSGSAHVPL